MGFFIELFGLTGQQAMRFTVYGVKYDTSEMKAFATGDRNEPTVYIDRDCRVFVKSMEKGKPCVRWASRVKIQQLASRYGIEELHRAARHVHLPEHVSESGQ